MVRVTVRVNTTQNPNPNHNPPNKIVLSGRMWRFDEYMHTCDIAPGTSWVCAVLLHDQFRGFVVSACSVSYVCPFSQVREFSIRTRLLVDNSSANNWLSHGNIGI